VSLWTFKDGANGVGLLDLPGQRNRAHLKTSGWRWKVRSPGPTRAKKKARRLESAGFQSVFSSPRYEILGPRRLIDTAIPLRSSYRFSVLGCVTDAILDAGAVVSGTPPTEIGPSGFIERANRLRADPDSRARPRPFGMDEVISDVIAFCSESTFAISGRAHLEYWIPAADMDAFNEAIVGKIEIVREFP
jgi:hypothetical protein